MGFLSNKIYNDVISSYETRSGRASRFKSQPRKKWGDTHLSKCLLSSEIRDKYINKERTICHSTKNTS